MTALEKLSEAGPKLDKLSVSSSKDRPRETDFYDSIRPLYAKLERQEASKLPSVILRNEFEAEASYAQALKPRVGWVSTWHTRCGIAAYSEGVSSLVQDIYRFGPKLLESETGIEEPSLVVRMWEAGFQGSLDLLEEELRGAKLDVIIFQINYGFFNFKKLNALVQSLVASGLRVFMEFHSTVDPPPEFNTNVLDDLTEALQVADEIFVHTPSDVARLRKFDVAHNVVLLPLAVPEVEAKSELPSANLVVSYGFFLPNKGLLELIEAAGIAKSRGDPFSLLLVNADYGDSGGVSASLIQEARLLIRALDLDNDVTLVTEYQTDQASMDLVSLGQVVVFPYQRTGESSSAAVRFGIASGRPVAVTPLSIFDDVRSITHTLPGIDSGNLAIGIVKLLRQISEEPDFIEEVQFRAKEWCVRNSYSNLSKFYSRRFKVAAATPWRSVHVADISKLPTQVGTLVNGAMSTAGVAGVLLHGPYIDLPAGRYLLELGLVCRRLSEVSPTVRILSNHGNVMLAETQVDLDEIGENTASVLFSSNLPIKNLELVVYCGRDDKFSIEKFEIFVR
jgi:glycosyltransferase involved in cell wall biosynthesis